MSMSTTITAGEGPMIIDPSNYWQHADPWPICLGQRSLYSRPADHVVFRVRTPRRRERPWPETGCHEKVV